MIKYHAFAKAVEMRSISKAAEILGYSRSKLSNIIGSLEDEICLAVNKSNPLAQQDALMAHDLRDVPIIYSPPGWDDITRIVINRLPFKPKIRCYSASDLAALAMVQSNMGVYVISNLQKSLLPKDVVAISFQEHYRRTVGVAVRSMKDLTDSQRTFFDACIESFK